MKFWEKNKTEILIVLVIFLVALVPRILDLGTFLTADEKNWIGRSYEFIRAFKDWRFNDMLQTTHPGVTTLWISGLAVTAKIFLSHTPFSFGNIQHFVGAAQFPVALLNSLAIPAIYLLLRKLFEDRGVVILAALFMALNPFLVGYSRVAHVDALLASFLFLAVLAISIYAKNGYSQKWLIASAVLSALAILTKIPGVFVLPFFVLTVWVFEGKGFWRKRVLLERLRDFVVWLLVIGLVIVIVWPALIWVPDPEGNVLLVKRDIVTAAATPHHMADTYRVEAWHYPATLLTRSTPVILALAVIALVGLLLPPPRSLRDHSSSDKGRKKFLWLLIAYIFFFIVMMTLGAKKGDRYILSVFPALDVLAAVGLVALFKPLRFALARHLPFVRREKTVYAVLSGIIVLFLVVTLVRYHPYTIAYSNPLFPENLSQELGWGEGLEQVGTWLSENDPEAVVASWYPQELKAYTSAAVAHINAHEQGKIGYVVLYKNMFGRAPDHYANDFIDEYYSKREPVFVAKVVGKEFAWVYQKPVYRGTVGELLPGKTVSDELEVKGDKLIGIDVLVATYSGRATVGDLVVSASDGSGSLLQTWQVSVANIEDDQWLKLKLDRALEVKGQKVNIEISTAGTQEENAPTIRSNKEGKLGLRGRYLLPDREEAIDEHAKLI